MIPVDKYPALVAAEDALMAELSRQSLTDEIAPSSSFNDAFFDEIDGELVGRPVWSTAVLKAIEAWEEAKDE